MSIFIDNSGLRGVMASVVYIPSSNGNLYVINAENGQPISTKNFVHPLFAQPIMGKTTAGESILL